MQSNSEQRLVRPLSKATCLTIFAILAFLAVQFEVRAQNNAENSSSNSQNSPVKLETETLELKTGVGTFKFEVEIADDPEERMIGLMHRKKMDLKHGMLFQFGNTSLVNMWMRNTVLSLDMIFIRPDGTIAKIARRTTPFSEDIITSGEPVSHVLELNAGVAAMVGLKANHKVLHRYFPTQ
ncbi:MAG: DUF192 domain-containing protein [Rhizobiaceae bacterium]